MRHAYISTYCQHEKHDDCRLTCKICEAACICPCHLVTWISERETAQIVDERLR